MENSKLVFWAFIDSVSIFLYILLVAFIISNGQSVFGHMDSFSGPVLFLLLFVVSAVITGGLFLGRPLVLYFDNFKKEAVKLFFYTILFLVLIGILFLFVRSFYLFEVSAL